MVNFLLQRNVVKLCVVHQKCPEIIKHHIHLVQGGSGGDRQIELYVHVYAHMCRYVCLCACTWRPEVDIGYLPVLFSSLFLRWSLSLNLKLDDLARHPAVSIHPTIWALDYRDVVFLCESWDLNSGHHSFTALYLLGPPHRALEKVA